VSKIGDKNITITLPVSEEFHKFLKDKHYNVSSIMKSLFIDFVEREQAYEQIKEEALKEYLQR